MFLNLQKPCSQARHDKGLDRLGAGHKNYVKHKCELFTGHRAPGTGHRAPGTGHGHRARAPGTGHRAPDTGHRTPGTGHRAPGTGHRAPGTGHRTPGTPGTGHRAPGAPGNYVAWSIIPVGKFDDHLGRGKKKMHQKHS